MITFSRLGTLGRLGNQMFQYAALVGIANKLNCSYGIKYFRKSNILIDLVKGFDLSAINISEIGKNIYTYKSRRFSFDPKVFSLSSNTDIFALLQSEKYFQHCADKIRAEFQFKSSVEKEAQRQIFLLRDKKKLVSIHVRRCDYLSQPFLHPPCSLNYYQKAIEFFKNAKFVIFSDDIDWCRQNFLGDNFTYVVGNSQYVDMCMMSLCDHHIIANSTFSWWGAWLNPNSDKIVVAPKRWFGIAFGDNTEDLYPQDWIIVGSWYDYFEYELSRFLPILEIKYVNGQISRFIKHPEDFIPGLKRKIKSLFVGFRELRPKTLK